MKKYIICLYALAAVCCASCSDWLDVRGENVQKENDQFGNYKGFRDALTGCYITLADNDIYGQALTMTHIETLANLWYCPDSYENDAPGRYALHTHNYSDENTFDIIEAIYAKLFNVIAQANLIMKHVEEDGNVIPSAKTRSVIAGEAYAIRAFCQFDVLRLFGQLPEGATKQVMLPYSEITDISSQPAYYGYADYVKKLEADLNQAVSLLKENDPIFEYTFSELNQSSASLNDTYFYYRQSRMNYWAVRALQARFYLYIGDTATAHTIAMEIINAKDSNGNPVIALSGTTDFPTCHTCASECLFYLSKFDVKSSSNSVLLGSADVTTQISSSVFVINVSMRDGMYAEYASKASHNRYKNLWGDMFLQDRYGQKEYISLKKYTHADDANDLMIKHQIIPLLRMSEIYLIAIETSDNLDEVNSLYTTYMESCDMTIFDLFTSVEQMREWIIREYHRKFYGEGQMFYTYKRLGANSMIRGEQEVTESEYILPLPSTEYNPN